MNGKAKTIGFEVALNTVGWQAQDVLSSTVDALIGDPLLASVFGGEQPVPWKRPSRIPRFDHGNLSLTADSAAAIDATTGNEATSNVKNDFAIAAKYGANGMAAARAPGKQQGVQQRQRIHRQLRRRRRAPR